MERPRAAIWVFSSVMAGSSSLMVGFVLGVRSVRRRRFVVRSLLQVASCCLFAGVVQHFHVEELQSYLHTS